MPVSQRIVKVCLFIVAAIAVVGGTLQLTTPRLPTPHAVWLGYLVPELLLPVVIPVAHRATPASAMEPLR